MRVALLALLALLQFGQIFASQAKRIGPTSCGLSLFFGAVVNPGQHTWTQTGRHNGKGPRGLCPHLVTSLWSSAVGFLSFFVSYYLIVVSGRAKCEVWNRQRLHHRQRTLPRTWITVQPWGLGKICGKWPEAQQMRNQMPADFLADISIAVKVFSAHLHKAEPHLQTLDLVVFSIGDVIQATGCPESRLSSFSWTHHKHAYPPASSSFSSLDRSVTFCNCNAWSCGLIWFVMICQLIRPAGGWSVWWELCSWLQGGKEGFTFTYVSGGFQEVLYQDRFMQDLSKCNLSCSQKQELFLFHAPCLICIFLIRLTSFVFFDIFCICWCRYLAAALSLSTVALLCRWPEALKEESPGRAGAAGLDTLVSGIPELYKGRTTILCAAKIYAKYIHLTKSYSHTGF